MNFKDIRRIVTLFTLMIFFLSCSSNNNDETINPNKLSNSTLAPKDKKQEKKSSVKIAYDKTHHNEFYDIKLIGLAVKDSSKANIYERYWLDFYTTCMWSSQSIYIDTQNNKFHCVEFSETPLFKKEEIKETFNITKVQSQKQRLIIDIENEQEIHKIEFIKQNDEDLYLIKMDAIMQNSDMGRHKFYITKAKEGKFEKEGCGDFEG